jgi:DNA-binding response OmpR family regulator
MTPSHSILVADENAAAREFLADNLTADGYHVLVAPDRAKAIALLDVNHPDLVVVDVNGDTLALIDAVRSADGVASRIDPDTPMIVLTGNPVTIHRVRMLERGGDDVVAKPFSYPELRARIAAVLRRTAMSPSRRLIRVGALTIDAAARRITVGGRQVELSAKEYDFLLALAADPTRVFTRQELLRNVWGFHSPARTRTLDCHASRLRRKLKDAGGEALIVNVWGVGYRLIDGVLQ